MEWAQDDKGNTILLTMTDYRIGKLLDTAIAVRMVFAGRQDQPETHDIVVQAAMTVPQVREFVAALSQAVEDVISPPQGRTLN